MIIIPIVYKGINSLRFNKYIQFNIEIYNENYQYI